MKFGLSSSGCDPRPAKGGPPKPVVSLATVVVTQPAMRRRARRSRDCGRGECSHENYAILGAESFLLLEGHGSSPKKLGRGVAPGGVYDPGTQEEDGPGIWEAHVPPR